MTKYLHPILKLFNKHNDNHLKKAEKFIEE